MLIVTSKSRERAARPTDYGMHPAVAARLKAFGIDPEDWAHQIAQQQGRARPSPQAKAEQLRKSATELGLVGPDGRAFDEMSLDPEDVRVTPLLNQAALLYEDNDYVADIVAPVQLVTERAAKYKVWDRGPYRGLLDARIGPNGSAKEISPTLSEKNYSMERRALKGFANDDTDLANPSIDAGIAAVEQVQEVHYVNREYDIATAFHTTANYPGANVKTLTTGGGGTNWKQGSGANPISDMLTLMEAIPGALTHCVMTDIVWHSAQQNAALKNILASQLDNKGLLRPMDFSLYFGIPNMIITQADYRDDTGARKRLWSETNLWMGRIDPRRDRRTFFRTFRLRQGAGGWVTKRWRDEDRGANGGVWVRVAYEEARHIVSSDYGAVIVNVVG